MPDPYNRKDVTGNPASAWPLIDDAKAAGVYVSLHPAARQ